MFSWHMDGDGSPVAVHPEIAEVYQLDMWLNPHGFLKAARMPGANPVAFWRWEQIEKGRDGNVVRRRVKMHVVAIEMFGGKYRVDATINSRNLIQRLKTTVNIPALGDFNIEHESTNFVSIGNVKWPTNWHSHQGWDDNWQFYRQSTGHNAYGGSFPDIRPNDCGDPVPVPESVAEADWSTEVTVDEIADGVYRLGGNPANSYMIEFSDFVAVFEAPGDEEWSLKIIDRITKLAPDKPVRFVIASHPHFDHIGGLRTYLHVGSTIVTHMINLEFLNHDVLTYEPRTIKPDIISKWAADGAGRGLQLRGGPGELRHHRQLPDPARLLRAAATTRRRDADGVPAGRAHRLPVGPVRHARAAATGTVAVDARPAHPGGAHEPGRGDAGPGARGTGALERLPGGAGAARAVAHGYRGLNEHDHALTAGRRMVTLGRALPAPA